MMHEYPNLNVSGELVTNLARAKAKTAKMTETEREEIFDSIEKIINQQATETIQIVTTEGVKK